MPGGDLPDPVTCASPHPGVPLEGVAIVPVNDSPLPVATRGDPTESELLFSLRSLRDLLSDSDEIHLTWPAFAALRGAARATKAARLRMALSALVSEARLVFGACFLLARSAPAPAPRSLTRPGRRLHAWICTLLNHGSVALPLLWNWNPAQYQSLHQHLLCLVAPPPPPWAPAESGVLSAAGVLWHHPPRPYPATHYAFLHSLRAGLPWSHALDALAHLPHGHFSADGRIFCVPALAPGGVHPDACLPLRAPSDPDALTLFFHGSAVVAICSSHSVLARPTPAPSAGVRLLRSGAPSRFLPDYIRLKKLPSRDVMSVFMASPNWHKRLGPLDAVAATVAEGRMVMPKPRLPLRHSRRPNHASWERNEAAKIALGPKFATWIWQGVVEMVPQGCPLPLFIEPLGAVDKATAPWWRLILDARISNEYQDPWGVWYFSVSQLAALLDACDIMFAEDLEDAYHLSIFAGCTGKPFWSCVFAIDEDGQVVRRWRLVMGCDPSTDRLHLPRTL